jgi:hypothetical protein
MSVTKWGWYGHVVISVLTSKRAVGVDVAPGEGVLLREPVP